MIWGGDRFYLSGTVLKQSLDLQNEVDVSQRAAGLLRYAFWLEDLALEKFLENEKGLLENETISLFYLFDRFDGLILMGDSRLFLFCSARSNYARQTKIPSVK